MRVLVLLCFLLAQAVPSYRLLVGACCRHPSPLTDCLRGYHIECSHFGWLIPGSLSRSFCAELLDSPGFYVTI